MGHATTSFAATRLPQGILVAAVFFIGVTLTETAASATSVDGVVTFNRGRFDDSLKALRPLADAGDSVAQCYAARILNAATGGVKRDLQLAKQYGVRSIPDLSRKAKDGNAAAKACLSVLKSTPVFGEPQADVSFQLAKEAALLGNVDGQRLVGNKFERGEGVARDYGQAHQWLEKASKANNVLAELAIALAKQNGRGVSKDETAAANQVKVLAETGYAVAQTEYALLLRRGVGIPQDFRKAKVWYERAAAQFDARAQNDLGYMYQHGLGVAVDLVQASHWYQLSADQGTSLAQSNLGRMYLYGRGVPKDESKGIAYLRASANQNNPRGQYHLGVAFERGAGVPADAVQALGFYRKSAAQSDRDAAKAIKRLTGKNPETVANARQKVESIGEH